MLVTMGRDAWLALEPITCQLVDINRTAKPASAILKASSTCYSHTITMNLKKTNKVSLTFSRTPTPYLLSAPITLPNRRMPRLSFG